MTGRYWFAPIMVLMFILLTGPGLGADKVRFAAVIKTKPLYVLPIVAAQEKGFFKNQGLEVQYVGFTSGRAFSGAMAAGALDMAFVGTLSISLAAARGGPGRAVADTGAVEDWFLWVPANSRLKKPMDLRGNKIAVSRMGSLTHALARAVIKSLGIEKEVQTVAAGGVTSAIASLKSGASDATVQTFSAMAPLEVKGEVRQLLTVGNYVPKAVFTLLLAAHEKFLKENPEVVKRGIRAYMQGAKFTMENRSWAIERMTTYPDFGLTGKVAQSVYSELRYAQGVKKVPRKNVRAVMNWLVENGLLRAGEVPPMEKVAPAEYSE